MAQTYKSIFSREIKIDLNNEFEEFMRYLGGTKIKLGGYRSTSFADYLNKLFLSWPYRGSAITIYSYLEKRGIKIDKRMPDQDVLCAFELFYNLIRYFLSFQRDPYSEMDRNNMKLFDFAKQSIDSILENIDMKAEEQEDRFIFVRRDADVASVLMKVPKLNDHLLNYLDFRNEHDVVAKRTTLKYLADYIEKNEQFFKENKNYKGLHNTFSYAVNNFHIRHDNEDQVDLGKETEKVYDDVFYLCLFLIRAIEMKDVKNNIESYKKSKKAGDCN